MVAALNRKKDARLQPERPDELVEIHMQILKRPAGNQGESFPEFRFRQVIQGVRRDVFLSWSGETICFVMAWYLL